MKILSLAIIILLLVLTFGIRPGLTDENPTDREKCENFAIEMKVSEIDTTEFTENCISHLKACDLVTCDDFSFLDNTDTSNDEVINDVVLLNE